MKHLVRHLQHGMTASVLAVALFVTGAAALAATDTGAAPDEPTPDGETTNASDLAVGSQMALPVADVGVVTIARDISGLSLVSAMADPGWQIIVERGSGRELEVSFRASTIRHDANLELEDGTVRIRIRTRTTSTTPSSTTTTTATSPTSTTSTTATSSTTSTPPTSTPPTSSTPMSSTPMVPSTSSTTSPTSSTSTTSTTAPRSTTSTSPSTTVSPPVSERTEVIDSIGGSVTVTISGNHLTLVHAVPSPGYDVDVRERSGDDIDVRFESDDHESRINLRASDGSIRRDVENR